MTAPRHRRLSALLTLLAAASLAGAPLAAQHPIAPQALLGSWQATMHVGSFPLRLVLHIEPGPAGALDGTLVSVDQGGAAVPLEGAVRGDSVRVVMESIAASFAGRLSPDRNVIEGRWRQ
ncbi:MAG TPA: hypothetical protein VFX98_11210, partial [Longimicrobiaceae bacterium]|nr:hypothetical protein [Longimicrobiaceae bacterium]